MAVDAADAAVDDAALNYFCKVVSEKAGAVASVGGKSDCSREIRPGMTAYIGFETRRLSWGAGNDREDGEEDEEGGKEEEGREI